MAARFDSPLDRLRAEWDARAARDPLQASCPEQESWTEEAFLASGRALLAARVLPAIAGLGSAVRAAAMRVLDLGCGAGRLAVPLRAHCGEVHAVDVSPRMLARARELTVAAGIDGVRFALSDGLTLQCVNRQRFHLALCIDVLGHQPQEAFVRYLLGQMQDKLEPGGLLIADLPAGWDEPRVDALLGLLSLEREHRETQSGRTWLRLRRPSGRT